VDAIQTQEILRSLTVHTYRLDVNISLIVPEFKVLETYKTFKLIGAGVAADKCIAIGIKPMLLARCIKVLFDPDRIVAFVVHEQQSQSALL